MRRRILISALAFFLCLGLAQPIAAQSKLTNADVVKMVEGRVPPPIIVATIERSAEANFDLGPDALVELKRRGVPDAVIEVMMKKTLGMAAATPSSAPAASSADAKPTGEWASRDPGVYLEIMGATGKELMKLSEATISEMKIGGGLGGALSYGVKKMTIKHRVRDGVAAKRGKMGSVTIYAVGLNPRNLVLLRLSKKGKEREFESGKIGGMGGGIELSKGDLEFGTEEVVPGVYRITLSRPLEPGEYGLGVPQMGEIRPLYDFGIDR